MRRWVDSKPLESFPIVRILERVDDVMPYG
jgi:hypothetical protein